MDAVLLEEPRNPQCRAAKAQLRALGDEIKIIKRTYRRAKDAIAAFEDTRGWTYSQVCMRDRRAYSSIKQYLTNSPSCYSLRKFLV